MRYAATYEKFNREEGKRGKNTDGQVVFGVNCEDRLQTKAGVCGYFSIKSRLWINIPLNRDDCASSIS